MWPHLRAKELIKIVNTCFSKPVTKFAFLPSRLPHLIDYFPSDFTTDFRRDLPTNFEYVPLNANVFDADLIIITHHGADQSNAIWKLRSSARSDTLILIWLWDNHIMPVENLKNSMAADFVFPSHKYASGHLSTPVSCLASHVPSCCAQWTKAEATQFVERFALTQRRDQLLVNYADYPWSPRSQVLHALKNNVPEADVRLMPPDDRSRYFSKSRSDRYQEWLEHKATIILPVVQDVSTRVFDALLAGQVLVVPETVADFDGLFPRSLQSQLGIVRIPDLELATIRDAAAKAIQIFDEQGLDGAIARYRYALENHMLVNRIGLILQTLKGIADGQFTVKFDGDQNRPYGLWLQPLLTSPSHAQQPPVR